MTKRSLILLLLIYFIQTALSFTCADLNESGPCTTVPGCIWSSESCDGAISCGPPACYFLDPTFTGTSNGTAAQPYKDLPTVLTLMTQESTLFIYNPVPGMVLPALVGKSFTAPTTIRLDVLTLYEFLGRYGMII